MAVAVSGGADSLALTLLADAWARARGGDVLGLIVDHGLRPASAAEAAATQMALCGRGIAARVLTLRGVAPTAAAARAARYAALEQACAETGRLHLLLGHHAADQAETVAMRLLAGSFAAGLAGMPALAETSRVRLLRPLLAVPPVRLRATLQERGLGWIDDPSNASPQAQRSRLRALRRDRDGSGVATRAAVIAAAARGAARAAAERALASLLARRVRLAPEGFAVISAGPLPAAALAAVLRTIAGSVWAPSAAALAARPRPATLGGARLLPAGRLAPGGWLAVREAAAMEAPVAAMTGALWDGRFRLFGGPLPDGLLLGALGRAAARLRGRSDLPSAVLAALPALWWRGGLAAVPHLGYFRQLPPDGCVIMFQPGHAMVPSPFHPADPMRLPD